jgi:hypothetical protein
MGHVHVHMRAYRTTFFIHELSLSCLVLAAKQGALDVLNQILEFDVARLLHHFDRFLSHKAEH